MIDKNILMIQWPLCQKCLDCHYRLTNQIINTDKNNVLFCGNGEFKIGKNGNNICQNYLYENDIVFDIVKNTIANINNCK